MSFSKNPVIATHQLKRIPISGSSTLNANTRNSSQYRGSRFINCWIERTEQFGNDPKHVLRKAPGLVTSSITVPADTIGGVDTAYSESGLTIIAAGQYILSANGTATPTTLHSAVGDLKIKSIQKVQNYASTDVLYAGVHLSGSNYKVFTYNATTDTFTSGTTFSSTTASEKSLFLNGYLFVADKTTGNIYNTNAGGVYATITTGTDFIVPEIEADSLVDIAKHRNYLVAFGTKSVEFFYDGGVQYGSPLVRQESYAQKIGAISSACIETLGDDIYYIGIYGNSKLGVFRIRDFQVKKISDDYLEALLGTKDDIGYLSSTTGLSLGFVTFYGQYYLAIRGTQSNGSNFNFLYREKEGTWFEFVHSTGSGLAASNTPDIVAKAAFLMPGIMLLNGASESVPSGVYFGTQVGTSIPVQYFENDYTGTVSTTAEFVMDFLDFDSQNQRHIKWIDLVGDYGSNTVELALTGASDFSSWGTYQSLTPSSVGLSNPLRYSNMGRYRRTAARLRFKGADSIMHEGIEMAYNLGAY